MPRSQAGPPELLTTATSAFRPASRTTSAIRKRPRNSPYSWADLARPRRTVIVSPYDPPQMRLALPLGGGKVDKPATGLSSEPALDQGQILCARHLQKSTIALDDLDPAATGFHQRRAVARCAD